MRIVKNKILTKLLSLYIAISFLGTLILPTLAQAAQINLLPSPDKFVPLSESYSFPVLKGLKFDPLNPLQMEFIIDTASEKNVGQEEAARLIRYFLAGLTLSEDDIWVNLSPYEKEKVGPANLTSTDLGKDLLSQDYILKQISASLTYPESQTGKDFWMRVYDEVFKIARTTNLPVNTFNKIWIMPEKALVYEGKDYVWIAEASLKTVLEEDYLALKNKVSEIQKKKKNMKEEMIEKINKVSSQVMREFILPKIYKDVNSGKNFATLRQIYHSLVLAVWFKKKFKDSLYRYYIDKGKTKGIDLEDKETKEKIYNLYIEAFTKGLYKYIKTDVEPATRRKIKRQYFSGGFCLKLNPAEEIHWLMTGEMPQMPGFLKPQGRTMKAPTGMILLREGVGEQEAGSPIKSQILFYDPQNAPFHVSTKAMSSFYGYLLNDVAEKITQTGLGYEVEIPRMDQFKAYLEMNRDEDYVGYLKVEKLYQGREEFFQMAYRAPYTDIELLLTFKPSRNPITGGWSAIIQPRERIIINGYGTIGKKIADMLRKLGYEIIGVVNTGKVDDEGRPKSFFTNDAIYKGYPLYLAKGAEKNLEKATVAGLPYKGNIIELLEQLRKEKKQVIVVDASTGGKKEKETRTGWINKENIYKPYSDVIKLVIFQGGEDPDVAEASFALGTAAWQSLKGKQYLQVVSCNTTDMNRSYSGLKRTLQQQLEQILFWDNNALRRERDPGAFKEGAADEVVVKSSNIIASKEIREFLKIPTNIDLVTTSTKGLYVHLATVKGIEAQRLEELLFSSLEREGGIKIVKDTKKKFQTSDLYNYLYKEHKGAFEDTIVVNVMPSDIPGAAKVVFGYAMDINTLSEEEDVGLFGTKQVFAPLKNRAGVRLDDSILIPGSNWGDQLGGITVVSKYHHSDDLIKTFMYNEDREILVGRINTPASMIPTTHYHIHIGTVEAEGLNAEKVREVFKQEPLIAVVDFPDGVFATSKIFEVVNTCVNEEVKGASHAKVSIVQVKDSQIPGEVKVIRAVPQESIVMPENGYTLHAALGTFSREESVRIVNEVNELDRIKRGIEERLPLPKKKQSQKKQEATSPVTFTSQISQTKIISLEDIEKKILDTQKPIFIRINSDVVSKGEIKDSSRLEEIYEFIGTGLLNYSFVTHGFEARPWDKEYDKEAKQISEHYRYVGSLSILPVAKWYAQRLSKEAERLEEIKNDNVQAHFKVVNFRDTGKDIHIILLHPDSSKEETLKNNKIITSLPSSGYLVFRENRRYDQREQSINGLERLQAARELSEELYDMGISLDTAASHREEATNVEVAELMPIVPSYHIKEFLEEVDSFKSDLLAVHKQGGQIAVIPAGIKKDKIDLGTRAIGTLVFKGDWLIPSGAILASFLKSEGKSVGAMSVSEKDLKAVGVFLKEAEDNGVNVYIAHNLLVIPQVIGPQEEDISIKVAKKEDIIEISDGNIPAGYVIADIGDIAFEEIKDILKKTKAILEFGPISPYDKNPLFNKAVEFVKFLGDEGKKEGKVVGNVGADTYKVNKVGGVLGKFKQSNQGGAFLRQITSKGLNAGIMALVSSGEEFADQINQLLGTEGRASRTVTQKAQETNSPLVVSKFKPSLTTALGSETVRLDVELTGGGKGHFVIAAGTSTGADEAKTIMDKLGFGQVVENITKIDEAVKSKGLKADQLAEIGQLMLSMGKDELGAEATLPYQMASAWAVASQKGLEHYEFLREFAPDLAVTDVPGTTIQYNITNGGEHAENSLDMQEFMIDPHAKTTAEENKMCDEIDRQLGLIYQALGLKAEPNDKGVGKLRGKEGGYSIPNLSNEELLYIYANAERYHIRNLDVVNLRNEGIGIHEFVLNCKIAAIKNAGYIPSRSKEPGTVALSLDPATTSMLVKGHNNLYHFEGRMITSEELINIYLDWIKKYPIDSIEDGLGENDWDGWIKLIKAFKGTGVTLIGDDLLVTQGPRLMKLINLLIENGLIDKQTGKLIEGVDLGILIKLNQNQFLTTGINNPAEGYLGTIEVMRLAKQHGMFYIISHRSKEAEPEDNEVSIADVAAAFGARKLKSGDHIQEIRAIKEDRLAEIDARERAKVSSPFTQKDVAVKIIDYFKERDKEGVITSAILGAFKDTNLFIILLGAFKDIPELKESILEYLVDRTVSTSSRDGYTVYLAALTLGVVADKDDSKAALRFAEMDERYYKEAEELKKELSEEKDNKQMAMDLTSRLKGYLPSTKNAVEESLRDISLEDTGKIIEKLAPIINKVRYDGSASIFVTEAIRGLLINYINENIKPKLTPKELKLEKSTISDQLKEMIRRTVRTPEGGLHANPVYEILFDYKAGNIGRKEAATKLVELGFPYDRADTYINQVAGMYLAMGDVPRPVTQEAQEASSAMDKPGGIDLGGIDVATAPASIPVNLPAFDFRSFEGFTFQILKIEPISIPNLNIFFGVVAGEKDPSYAQFTKK